jgi:hypothetical protein
MKRLADRRPGVRLIIFLLLLALPFPALLGCGGGDLTLPTEYQAVFLDNGQVFFGKLEKARPSYITLRDVFYVQTQVDQEKKQAKNILVKRGLEWHAPDFMQINTRHVVLIEPVAPESQVAQLIRRFKKGPPLDAPKVKEEEKQPPASAPAAAPKAKPKEVKRPQTGR